MKIGIRLTLLFFAIAFLSMLVIGLISYNKGKVALEEETFNKLTAVREMKASQIEDYFQLIHDQVQTFSEDRMVIFAMKRLKEGFTKIDSELKVDEEKMKDVDARLNNYFEKEYLSRLNPNLDKKASIADESTTDKNARILQDVYIVGNPNPVGSKDNFDSAPDTSTYSKAHKSFHPVVKSYLDKFGYYDIFLIDHETGNIVYTVFKEVDFGTSLLTGPFKETNLAEVFRAAKDADKKDFVKLVDYKPYHPSYNAPAAFIAAPIFDGDKKIGVLAFQMPIERINSIMTSKEKWSSVGLGASGETYIVGEDYTLRNQSRFLIEDKKNYLLMIEEIGMPKPAIEKISAFNSAIGLQVVKTRGTEAALAGETNAKIFPDYRGVPVLSSYRPLNIPGMHWVIMSEIDEAEAHAPAHTLRKQILLGFSGLVVIIIIASFFISRRMTRPLNELTGDAMELARGNFDVEITVNRKDEIGILALSFKKMQISIRNLVEELKHINQNLENKVIERTSEINRQKEMVEEKNKEIVDSINYALRLQQAILPPMDKVKQHLKECFIFFRPKDIVSGDFYWMSAGDQELLISAVDCTGHGVPGAMVSVVGANSLDRCVKEFGLKKPSDILDKLCDLVVETFETTDHEVKDGMDMALCSLNMKTGSLQYSGANNPLWIVRHGTKELEELKPNKQPVGKFEFRKPFTNQDTQLNKGDCVYMFTDGYADQFGGPKGKKFKYKTLKELLISIHELPMHEQRNTLEKSFEDWKGDLHQIDDVCIIGIRFS